MTASDAGIETKSLLQDLSRSIKGNYQALRLSQGTNEGGKEGRQEGKSGRGTTRQRRRRKRMRRQGRGRKKWDKEEGGKRNTTK